MSVKTLLLGLIRIFSSTLNPDLMDEMLKHRRIQCKKCLHTMCTELDCKYNICFCGKGRIMLVYGDENKDILMQQIPNYTFHVYISYPTNDKWHDIIKQHGNYKLLKASNQVKYYNNYSQGLLIIYRKSYKERYKPLSVVKCMNFKIHEEDSELIEYVNSSI